MLRTFKFSWKDKLGCKGNTTALCPGISVRIIKLAFLKYRTNGE